MNPGKCNVHDAAGQESNPASFRCFGLDNLIYSLIEEFRFNMRQHVMFRLNFFRNNAQDPRVVDCLLQPDASIKPEEFCCQLRSTFGCKYSPQEDQLCPSQS